jgi:hypothetical protein
MQLCNAFRVYDDVAFWVRPNGAPMAVVKDVALAIVSTALDDDERSRPSHPVWLGCFYGLSPSAL